MGDNPCEFANAFSGDVHETLFSGLTKIPTKGSTKVSKKLAEGAKKAGQKVWDKAKQVWNYELTD